MLILNSYPILTKEKKTFEQSLEALQVETADELIHPSPMPSSCLLLQIPKCLLGQLPKREGKTSNCRKCHTSTPFKHTDWYSMKSGKVCNSNIKLFLKRTKYIFFIVILVRFCCYVIFSKHVCSSWLQILKLFFNCFLKIWHYVKAI